ncbi:hypothetical protein AMTRI_Chr04g247530 [Amborella trichopoda]
MMRCAPSHLRPTAEIFSLLMNNPGLHGKNLFQLMGRTPACKFVSYCLQNGSYSLSPCQLLLPVTLTLLSLCHFAGLSQLLPLRVTVSLLSLRSAITHFATFSTLSHYPFCYSLYSCQRLTLPVWYIRQEWSKTMDCCASFTELKSQNLAGMEFREGFLISEA